MKQQVSPLRVLGAILLALVPGPSSWAETPPANGAGQPVVLSGGIGESEQAELAARETRFDLKLVFSLVQGNYVADVRVTIDEGRRTVVENVSEGPIFLAHLPSGRYRITAIYRGKPVIRDVRVADGRLRTEYFRWPADPVDDLPVSRWLDKD